MILIIKLKKLLSHFTANTSILKIYLNSNCWVHVETWLSHSIDDYTKSWNRRERVCKSPACKEILGNGVPFRRLCCLLFSIVTVFGLGHSIQQSRIVCGFSGSFTFHGCTEGRKPFAKIWFRIFSRVSKISLREIDAGYCDAALSSDSTQHSDVLRQFFVNQDFFYSCIREVSNSRTRCTNGSKTMTLVKVN